MKDLRFKVLTVGSNLFNVLYYVPKMNRWNAHPEKHTLEQRYALARTIMTKLRTHSKTITDIYGLENLPKAEDGGYIMYANHQGRYDALGILLAHDEPCSALWIEHSAKKFLARHVCALIGGKTIDTDKMLDVARTLRELTNEVIEGRKYLIFPEGMYDDNKNTLHEFKHGCFTCSLRSKTPIVPVTVYDSWKSMNTNSFKRVKTQVHFLKPIPYEEYGHLKPTEIAELVKSRIQAKLDEISNGEIDESTKNFQIK